MYMDSGKHTLATGGKAVLSRKAGGSFFAHGGYCWGKNLMIIPNAAIVQSWRAGDWAKKDRDSLLILNFEAEKGGGLLTMIHANLPDRHAGHLTQGWKDHYWNLWKQYLARKY